MGDFDKRKAFGIGGIVGAIAILANLSQIIDTASGLLDKPEKSVTTTSIVETVEKNTKPKETKKAEEKVVEPETEPPTEPQPKAVYLDSLKVAESSYRFFIENPGSNMDSIGNTYTGHILIASSDDGAVGNDCYAIYYLGGKYKTLSGTIAISDLSDEQPICELLVSCDDNVIYTTGQVGRATAPMEISLNVENCQWLKLSGATHSSWKGWLRFLLSDWKLEE